MPGEPHVEAGRRREDALGGRARQPAPVVFILGKTHLKNMDLNSVQYLNKAKEGARQVKLEEYQKTGVWPGTEKYNPKGKGGLHHRRQQCGYQYLLKHCNNSIIQVSRRVQLDYNSTKTSFYKNAACAA
jgi:hypothetical protein